MLETLTVAKKSSSVFFTTNKNCHFSVEKRSHPRTVSLVDVGLFMEEVTFLMSSSRLLQRIMGITCVFDNKKLLDIVKNFASVADNHGNLQRFRTETVVRAIICPLNNACV